MNLNGFAKVYDLKKSQIRHYTSLNVLTPNTSGEYPDYNNQCHDEMRDVLKYKEMGFDIEEISNLKAMERSTLQGNVNGSKQSKALLLEKIHAIEAVVKAKEDQIKDIYECIANL